MEEGKHEKIAKFLGIALFAAGCQTADGQNNEAAPPTVRPLTHANQLSTVILHDMHGLFGGYRIWLARTGDSYIQVRRPAADGSGMVEQHSKFQLTEEDIRALERVISKNNFSKTDCSDHDNSTDQSIVYLYADYGKRYLAACKYIRTNRKYPQFDAVSKTTAKIAFGHKAASESIFSGRPPAAEDEWKPPGFAEPDFSVFHKRKR